MEITELPLEDLWADIDFNSRGKVAPIDVVDIVESIRKIGLQVPIVVQKFELPRDGHNYRIISGYRRFAAFKVLGYPTIPCVVKENLSETDALIANLEENLKRADLNLLQEAKAVERLRAVGLGRDQIAERLGVSAGWVQIRLCVLSFPKDIQEECAKGTVNQTQVKQLYSLPREKQYEAIRKIKDKKLRGEKGVIINKPINKESKRARTKSEIEAMGERIWDTLGSSFTTRALAWAAGNISSLDLYREIYATARERGKVFQIPEEE